MCIPDDAWLIRALTRRGLRVARRDWREFSSADEDNDKAAHLVRSVWDYREDYPAFVSFTRRLPGPPGDLLNLRWTAHKRYLIQLAKAKVPVVPTTLFRAVGDAAASVDDAWVAEFGELSSFSTSLNGSLPKEEGGGYAGVRAAMSEYAGHDCVFKPATGTRGENICRLRLQDSEVATAHYVKACLQRESMLLQPFLPPVNGFGEVCLVFVKGCFAHAIHKPPNHWGMHRDSCAAMDRAQLPIAQCTCGAAVGVGSKNASKPPFDEDEDSEKWAEDLPESEHNLLTTLSVAAVKRLCRPTTEMLDVAIRAVRALPGGVSVIARVDLLPILRGGKIAWLVSEVEVGWAELFLRANTDTAETIVNAVETRCGLRSIDPPPPPQPAVVEPSLPTPLPPPPPSPSPSTPKGHGVDMEQGRAVQGLLALLSHQGKASLLAQQEALRGCTSTTTGSDDNQDSSPQLRGKKRRRPLAGDSELKNCNAGAKLSDEWKQRLGELIQMVNGINGYSPNDGRLEAVTYMPAGAGGRIHTSPDIPIGHETVVAFPFPGIAKLPGAAPEMGHFSTTFQSAANPRIKCKGSNLRHSLRDGFVMVLMPMNFKDRCQASNAKGHVYWAHGHRGFRCELHRLCGEGCAGHGTGECPGYQKVRGAKCLVYRIKVAEPSIIGTGDGDGKKKGGKRINSPVSIL